MQGGESRLSIRSVHYNWIVQDSVQFYRLYRRNAPSPEIRIARLADNQLQSLGLLKRRLVDRCLNEQTGKQSGEPTSAFVSANVASTILGNVAARQEVAVEFFDGLPR